MMNVFRHTRSSEQVDSDLKKRLEVLEKDIDGLRARNDELVSSNDNLCDENKKLQLKATKRLPMTHQENMYIENKVLEDKIARLEKRMKDMTQKLKNAESAVSNSVGGGFSNNNSDSAEIQELKNKIIELEGSTNEMKKLVSSSRSPKVPKDTTPKATLVKWVNELEVECSKSKLFIYSHLSCY